MATAITPLANITLGAAAASLTFSSISGSFRDLYLVGKFGHSVSGQGLRIRFNGDTASNYGYVEMYGDGSAKGTIANSSLAFIPLTAYGPLVATPSALVSTNIMDYSASKYKTVLTRRDESGYMSESIASRWNSSSTITSILIYPASGNIVAGSSFFLYGISS